KLALLLFVSIGSSTFASEPSLCVGRPISTNKKNLNCLKNHIENKSIKDNFKRLVDRRKDCIACSEEFSGERNFSPLFDLHFLTLKMERSPFGGHFSYVMFKESPTRIYRIWVYEIDTGTLRIREIEAIKPDAKMTKILTALKTSEYKQFWF
ncbi:MAG: hypothetical protein KDD50_02285, partial [Bdellovibrionales bacterium]|nr:hypothetical protein [Bdellovibrionales bacterium]